MKSLKLLTLLILTISLVGCSSSQDKSYKAQESVHKERLSLVDKYQKCLKDAGDDMEKTEVCDQYLKAAEALK